VLRISGQRPAIGFVFSPPADGCIAITSFQIRVYADLPVGELTLFFQIVIEHQGIGLSGGDYQYISLSVNFILVCWENVITSACITVAYWYNSVITPQSYKDCAMVKIVIYDTVPNFLRLIHSIIIRIYVFNSHELTRKSLRSPSLYK